MEKIKKYFKEIVFVVLFLIIGSGVVGYLRSANVEANNLVLLKNFQSIDGIEIKKKLQEKKVLVVQFWGTWCPVCRQELSSLEKIAKKKDINLITIAVNSGSNQEIKAFLQKHNVNFLVINDFNGTIAKKFKVSLYPTTIYYSANRKKVLKDSGFTSYLGFLSRIKLMEQFDAK